jgi:hypothetical protein
MASITKLLVAELDRELPGTRRALERVPEGQNDWKPHDSGQRGRGAAGQCHPERSEGNNAGMAPFAEPALSVVEGLRVTMYYCPAAPLPNCPA